MNFITQSLVSTSRGTVLVQISSTCL